MWLYKDIVIIGKETKKHKNKKNTNKLYYLKILALGAF